MKPKKKEVIVLDRNNLLAQPVTLSMLPFTASLTQIKVINAVVRKLQDIFKKKLNEKFSAPQVQMGSLFDSEELREHVLDKDDIMFDLHLSELGIQPKHYPVAFNTIFQMAGIPCLVPVNNGKGETGDMIDTLLKPILWNENVITETDKKTGDTVYKYKKPVISIVIKKNVANHIFDFNKWIDHYLDYTVTNSESSYSARIYIYISSKFSRDGSKFKEDYMNFRKIMGFIGENGEKYLYFSDFKRRVLEPAKQELEKKAKTKETDFYFDYKPIYKNNRKSRCPESIEFEVKLSELGNQLQSDKTRKSEEIELEKILKEKLQQTPAQMKSLLLKVSPANFKKFAAKVKALSADIEKGKIKVDTSVRRYVNKSLVNFITNELVEEVVPDPVPTKKQTPPAPKPQVTVYKSQLTEEQKKDWEGFLNLIKEKIEGEQFKIWFKPIVPYSVSNKDGNTKVVVIVPSQFFYEIIEEKFVDVMRASLTKTYGDKVQLFYNVGEGSW